jgi:hypothetical protein
MSKNKLKLSEPTYKFTKIYTKKKTKDQQNYKVTGKKLLITIKSNNDAL